MPPDLWQALLDPTAPLPAGWPTGALGAFLLFMFPVGGGIPIGVLMARNDGVILPVIALLYLISDLFLACTNEPMLALMRWMGRRVAVLGRIGDRFVALSARIGLRDGGARGPLGLILVSFAVSPTTGRAAAAAAGHGFFRGWTFAIIGDMGYFTLLMVSTLWLSDVLGNDRLVVGTMLVVTWFLPLLLRRGWRGGQGAVPLAPVRSGVAGATAGNVMATTGGTRRPRSRGKRGR